MPTDDDNVASMPRDNVTEQAEPKSPSAGGARRRRVRPFSTVLLGLTGATLVALAIGFINFAEEVTAASGTERPAAADGIVVFTGGQDRISGALTLLSEGLAKRLLISGVHPSTTESALATAAGGHENLFECCIDLGHEALNTIGNAEETAAWARKRGFHSLIIVTSSYHLPRSLAELGRVMPDARLEGHAITTSSLDLEHWWRKPESASLLFIEYVKLLAAEARLAATGYQQSPRHAGSL